MLSINTIRNWIAFTYYCPVVPQQVKDRMVIVHYYDRKPCPGMLFKAATALKLDLTKSWLIGDMISDRLTGYYAKCGGPCI